MVSPIGTCRLRAGDRLVQAKRRRSVVVASGWWLGRAWRGRDALPRVRRCTFGNRRSPFNLNSRLLVRFVQVLSIHVDSCSYGRVTPDSRERIPTAPYVGTT